MEYFKYKSFICTSENRTYTFDIYIIIPYYSKIHHCFFRIVTFTHSMFQKRLHLFNSKRKESGFFSADGVMQEEAEAKHDQPQNQQDDEGKTQVRQTSVAG